MRVYLEGDKYKGYNITGPTHNYLGIVLARDPDLIRFDLNILPAIGDCIHHDGFSEAEVRQWIRDGIAKANQELKANYSIACAEIVANDSRRPEVYRELARRIVHCAADATKLES